MVGDFVGMTRSASNEMRRGVSSVSVILSGVTAPEQIEFWQQVAPGSYSVRSHEQDARPLDMALDAAAVGTLLVTRFRSRPHLVVRSLGTVARQQSDFVKLRLYRRGGTRLLETGGMGRHFLRSDAVHIIDHSRPWLADHGDQEQVTIFLRHDAIGYDPNNHLVVQSLPLGGSVGRILADAVLSFAKEAFEPRPEDVRPLSSAMTGLLRGLISGGAFSTMDVDIRSARRAAMRRFLDDHLTEPSLGVETLRRAFGSSDATIYRDFADEGGVERYIVQRRLARAFDDLSVSPGARGVVSRVAERWGFVSQSHFSHAFVQRFGMRPGSAVGIALPDAVSIPGEWRESSSQDLEALHARLASLYKSFGV